jgi:hypothetical protein
MEMRLRPHGHPAISSDPSLKCTEIKKTLYPHETDDNTIRRGKGEGKGRKKEDGKK